MPKRYTILLLIFMCGNLSLFVSHMQCWWGQKCPKQLSSAQQTNVAFIIVLYYISRYVLSIVDVYDLATSRKPYTFTISYHLLWKLSNAMLMRSKKLLIIWLVPSRFCVTRAAVAGADAKQKRDEISLPRFSSSNRTPRPTKERQRDDWGRRRLIILI